MCVCLFTSIKLTMHIEITTSKNDLDFTLLKREIAQYGVDEIWKDSQVLRTY